jgi:hypothetical protein
LPSTFAAALRESTSVSDHEPELRAKQKVLESMRAVLSDDHNYERGLAILRGIVDQVAADTGAIGLRNLAVALSLAVASALEEIASSQGLAAADLAEVWFAE